MGNAVYPYTVKSAASSLIQLSYQRVSTEALCKETIVHRGSSIDGR